MFSALPKELVERLGVHRPAYFDDSDTAHTIKFETTKHGLRYYNLIEEKIKERYKEMFEE